MTRLTSQSQQPSSRAWAGGRWVCLLLPLGLSACTGQILDPTGKPRLEVSPIDAGGLLRTAGPFGWQRLTAEQFDNTVRDVLGDNRRLATQRLSAEGTGSSGFATPGLVSGLDAERLDAIAGDLASAAQLKIVPGQLLPCDPATDEPGCALKFITTFGAQLFRRPLSTDEITDFTTLYASARSSLGHPVSRALALVLQAMLQAPAFLYLGDPDLNLGVLDEGGLRARLSPFPLAARLSYFLWGSVPDAVLFAAAQQGRLATREDVEREARRMLLDPKARETLTRFHVQWLKLQNVTSLSRADPDLTDAAKLAARAETMTFAQEVILAGDGRLATLLTATYGYPNKDLAKLYGVAVTSDVPVKTPLPNRWGLLTQVSLLATFANGTEGDPIRRGKFVREELLCQTLPAPPPNVPPLPVPMLGLTSRQRHEAHFSIEPCNSCHKFMDPIGFGLDQYDAVGKFQTMRANQVIDATGTVMRMDGANSPFTGPQQLAQLLSGSDEVRRCVAAKWLRFALGRGEAAADAPAVHEISVAFARTDYNVRELLVAIATSPSFTHRALDLGVTP